VMMIMIVTYFIYLPIAIMIATMIIISITRLMLHLDPRQRPSVDDLERLPSLLPYLTIAKNIVSDFKQQEVILLCSVDVSA